MPSVSIVALLVVDIVYLKRFFHMAWAKMSILRKQKREPLFFGTVALLAEVAIHGMLT